MSEQQMEELGPNPSAYGRFWPKFPKARANEDDYRREVAVNAELGRITAVETPETPRDTLFSDDSNPSTLRWPRCYGTIRVRLTPARDEWIPGYTGLDACYGILTEYISGLEMLTRGDITDERALEIKQLFADLHTVKVPHRDHVRHDIWPEVGFRNLFLLTNTVTGEKALVLGDTARDKVLLAEKAKRIADMLEQAMSNKPIVESLPREIKQLLADR
ncbi:putative Protein kinase domain-containing protein [Seiridium cardinale]